MRIKPHPAGRQAARPPGRQADPLHAKPGNSNA